MALNIGSTFIAPIAIKYWSIANNVQYITVKTATIYAAGLRIKTVKFGQVVAKNYAKYAAWPFMRLTQNIYTDGDVRETPEEFKFCPSLARS